MTARTVLNVDDSSDDVALMRLACDAAKTSFRFESVETADDAIAYLEGSRDYADRSQFPVPDLILLDLKMPGKSGFDVLAWLRGHPRFKHVPVIVFTSSVHAEDRARALNLGAAEYVVKPVSYEALQRVMLAIDRLLTSQGPLDLATLQLPVDYHRPVKQH